MSNRETAIFGAGCFWGVEEAFRTLPGVEATAVGYLGGKLVKPTYRDVCSDSTGHAEVVKVDFDPAVISFGKLLDVFWASHNPTQMNYQGPDHGSQYRSAIFFTTPEQKILAEASKAALESAKKFSRPIVTEVTATSTFYLAEDYHQQYLAKRGATSCHI